MTGEPIVSPGAVDQHVGPDVLEFEGHRFPPQQLGCGAARPACDLARRNGVSAVNVGRLLEIVQQIVRTATAQSVAYSYRQVNKNFQQSERDDSVFANQLAGLTFV